MPSEDDCHVNTILRQHKSLGIITGNTPESGALLWNLVNRAIRQEMIRRGVYKGDISFPNVSVLSIPEMGLSTELASRRGQVWNGIRKAMDQLWNVEMLWSYTPRLSPWRSSLSSPNPGVAGAGDARS